jgi:hypothetical protein
VNTSVPLNQVSSRSFVKVWTWWSKRASEILREII